MTVDDLPLVNASMNAASLACVLAGWWNIRRRNVTAHRICMGTAIAFSTLFLAGYLVYHYAHGDTRFPGQGTARWIYFSILGTHVPLAMVLLPLLSVTVWKAVRGDLAGHRRLVRWTLPIWLYVSVTGIVIYVMLYRVAWGA